MNTIIVIKLNGWGHRYESTKKVLREEDSVIEEILDDSKNALLITTYENVSIVINLDTIPLLKKKSNGVKLIKLADNDVVKNVTLIK